MGHEDSHVDVVPDNTTPEPTTDADDENTATRMSHDEQTPDVPVGAPLEHEGDESAGGVAATELDDDTPAQATDGSLTADDVSETRDADVSVTLDSGSSRAEQGVTTDGPDAPTRSTALIGTRALVTYHSVWLKGMHHHHRHRRHLNNKEPNPSFIQCVCGTHMNTATTYSASPRFWKKWSSGQCSPRPS